MTLKDKHLQMCQTNKQFWFSTSYQISLLQIKIAWPCDNDNDVTTPRAAEAREWFIDKS